MDYRQGDGTAPDDGGWVGEFTSADGQIRLVVNDPEYDWHIDAKLDHRPSVMKQVLLLARMHGFELMDEEEGDPEFVDDETIRIYLAPRAATEPLLRVVAA
jgi:hypothetical protein